MAVFMGGRMRGTAAVTRVGALLERLDRLGVVQYAGTAVTADRPTTHYMVRPFVPGAPWLFLHTKEALPWALGLAHGAMLWHAPCAAEIAAAVAPFAADADPVPADQLATALHAAGRELVDPTAGVFPPA